METRPVTVESPPAYIPTASQLERAAALRRFNWLTIYTPVILASLVTIALIALLLWGAFSPAVEGTGAFASALADLVLILAMLPMLLLCLIGPILAGVMVYMVYRQRQQETPPPLRRLQILLWRLDRLVDTVYTRLRITYLPKVANPVIEGYVVAAYIQTLLKQVRSVLNRS